MKIFVTGATGFIGSATVEELLKHNHKVLGLARSETADQQLRAAGAEVIRGDLEDTEALKRGASDCDGIIHLGFVHDFANFQKSCAIDKAAVKLMCDTLIGTNKAFVYTTGTMTCTKPVGELADESFRDIPEGDLGIRARNEELALSYANKGVRSMSVRLTPTVHGAGDHGFIPMIISKAKELGEAVYLNGGLNMWPAVHRKDAAVLYRLAIERAPPNSVLHAVAEEGISTKDIAKAIGKKLDLPAVSVNNEEFGSKFGSFFGLLLSLNNQVSSKKTKELLGWLPSQVKLLDDIEENY